MNSRERFLETVKFGRPDRALFWPQWTFKETRDRWISEGMPADVHFNSFFGFDRIEKAPLKFGLCPPFEEEVIEETSEWALVRDSTRALKKVWKRRAIGMPQWLEYGLRTRDDWEMFKERLNPSSPARDPEHFEDYARTVKERDYPLGIHAGSYYGWLRNWIGMENLALLYYDDPEWVGEMTNYIADFVLKVAERALSAVDFDYAILWEDMAMKTGSLISPEFVRELMLPCYKKVTSEYRAHGIETFMLDCDGNVEELVPIWLEGGVNGVYPYEVAAGCDVREYRRKYGDSLVIMGGIDKRALARTRADVEREVTSKLPELWRSGGYIPFVDHAVPPDVSLENFSYYLELVREICV